MGEWGCVSGETIAMGCGGRDEAGVGVRGGMAFGATGDEGCCCCPPPPSPSGSVFSPGAPQTGGVGPGPFPAAAGCHLPARLQPNLCRPGGPGGAPP